MVSVRNASPAGGEFSRPLAAEATFDLIDERFEDGEGLFAFDAVAGLRLLERRLALGKQLELTAQRGLAIAEPLLAVVRHPGERFPFVVQLLLPVCELPLRVGDLGALRGDVGGGDGGEVVARHEHLGRVDADLLAEPGGGGAEGGLARGEELETALQFVVRLIHAGGAAFDLLFAEAEQFGMASEVAGKSALLVGKGGLFGGDVRPQFVEEGLLLIAGVGERLPGGFTGVFALFEDVAELAEMHEPAPRRGLDLFAPDCERGAAALELGLAGGDGGPHAGEMFLLEPGALDEVDLAAADVGLAGLDVGQTFGAELVQQRRVFGRLQFALRLPGGLVGGEFGGRPLDAGAQLLKLPAVFGDFGPELVAEVGAAAVEFRLLNVDHLLLIAGLLGEEGRGRFALGQSPLAFVERLLMCEALCIELLRLEVQLALVAFEARKLRVEALFAPIEFVDVDAEVLEDEAGFLDGFETGRGEGGGPEVGCAGLGVAGGLGRIIGVPGAALRRGRRSTSAENAHGLPFRPQGRIPRPSSAPTR
jgi:hypothetical protein